MMHSFRFKTLLRFFLLMMVTMCMTLSGYGATVLISQGGTVNVNHGDLFYDAGGAAGNDNNTSYTITLMPAVAGEKVCVDFTMFKTYLGSLGGDVVDIYDGSTTASPNIGSLMGDYTIDYNTGATPYGVAIGATGTRPNYFSASIFCATNATGSLTIKFTNNYSSTSAGFAASIVTYKQLGTQACTATLTGSSSTVCSGGAVTLTATGSLASQPINSNFNSSSVGIGWSATASVMFTSNVCSSPSLDGTIYLWMANAGAPRRLTTNAMNVSNGGIISFDYRQATNNGSASPCESPDVNSTGGGTPEGVYVEYSNDNGATWTTFKYIYPYDMASSNYNGCGNYVTSWRNMVVPIPAAASTANTMFRWNQEIVTGASYDNWGLDNVKISSPKPSTLKIKNVTTNAVLASSATSPLSVVVNPTVTTTYRATITDGIDSCSQDFTVTIGTPSATISYPGNPYSTTLTTAQPVTFTGTTGGTYSSSPSGLTLNTSTGAITPNTSTTGTYTVTYTIPASGSCPAFTTTATVTIQGPSCSNCTTANCIIGSASNYNGALSNHISYCNTFSPSLTGPIVYKSYHTVTVGASGILGVVASSNNGGPAGCASTRTFKLFPQATSCNVATAINPTVLNANASPYSNPEWSGLTPGVYVLEITHTVTTGCTITDHCQSYYSPATTCTTCTSPGCPVSSVTATTAALGQSSISTAMNAAGNTLNTTLYPGQSVTICVPVVVPAGSTILGFKNLLNYTPGCFDPFEEVITYQLKPATACAGAAIAPNTTNASGVTTGFNPQWNNLAPGNYVLCYTMTMDPFALCSSIDIYGLGYYNVIPVTTCQDYQIQMYANATTSSPVTTTSFTCSSAPVYLRPLAIPTVFDSGLPYPAVKITVTAVTGTLANLVVKRYDAATNGFAETLTLPASGITNNYFIRAAPGQFYKLSKTNAQTGTYTYSIQDDISSAILASGTWTVPANLESAASAIVIPSGTASYSGPGVMNGFPSNLPTNNYLGDRGIGYFNPALAGVGTHTITYTWNNGLAAPNNCTLTRTKIVTVTGAIVPTFTQVAPICSGATLAALPTTSTNSITGTWSPALTNTTTTTYTFTPSAGQCATTANMTIVVNPNVTPTFTQVAPICSGATLSVLPTTSTNSITGTWAPSLNNTTTTTYTFTPSAGQCATTTNMTIVVNPNVAPTFTQVAPICSGAALSALPTTSTNNITGTWAPSLNNTTTTTYTFTPSAGQCATTANMTIVVNPNVAPTFTQVAPICSGAALSALPTTSTNSIIGTWTPALNNITTTTYTFTPSAGQCATTANMTIVVNPNVTPTFAQVAPICSGATLAALPTTSTNSITGTWSPSLNNTTTTTYTFTPIAGQCATTANMTIVVNPNVTPTFTQVAPICSGASLSALPTTSTNSITGTWSPAVNNTTTTTYTFTPSAGQCATTANMTIVVNPNVTPTFSQVVAICAGATLTALPTSSTNSPAINGTWSPALNNSTTTTYTFTPNAGQCATTATMTITVNPIVTPTFTAVAPICAGATLTALPTSSNNGITGTWTPALNNTTTTTYTFTPTAGQCASTTTLTIVVNPAPVVVVSCGVSTPTSVIFNWNTISGITGYSYSYTINGGSPITGTVSSSTTTLSVTSLTPGDVVSITVTPVGNACAQFGTGTCTASNCPSPVVNNVSNVNVCANQSIPAINFTSPTSGVVFNWTNNNTSIGLAASGTGAISSFTSAAVSSTQIATISVVAFDGICYGPTMTFTITVNPIVTPTFASVAPICSGATLTNLPTTSQNGIIGTWSPVLNNLSTTTYTFTPNAGQCASTATLSITVNPNITPTFASVAPICAGDNLNALPATSLNAINGTWSPALNNTTTTTYTFTPSAGQCATTASMTIVVNPILTPNFTTVNAICSGASMTALPTTSLNGIPGTWSPSLNNTTTTTYTFTPSVGQCASSASMAIVVNPLVTPNFTSIAAICAGDNLNALPTTSNNGITGTWSPVLNNTTTTTYTFTPSAGQCATATTMTIAVNPLLTPSFTQVAAICAGDNLNALPTTSNNGVIGTWSPALNNSTTTTYTFTPSANQCATTSTMTITVNPMLVPTFTQVSPVCAGAVINALPTLSNNGVAGSWSPTLNNTTTTTYTFTPSAGQCATTTTMSIVVNPLVSPTFTAVAPICAGDNLSPLPTTSTNGISGSWSPLLNNTTTTTYTFTPTAGQCATTATLTIIVNPSITPTFTPTAAICSGAVLNALPTTSLNGIIGSWSPALNNVSTTTYTFTPSAGQCATTTNMTIVVNPNVTPSFTQVPPICVGASLSALPTTSLNGITGSWSPALNNTSTTLYTFTPNAGQCATTANMTIDVNTLIVPTFSPISSICAGAVLNALPTTSLNGMNGSWSPALNNSTTTSYTFTPSSGQCADTATMTIIVNPVIVPNFTPLAAICAGENLSSLPSTSLNGIIGTWSPALNNLTTTTYTFTPIAGQCASNATMTIVVNPIPVCVVNCGTSTTTSVSFNWNAISGATGYDYSYTVNGGISISGSLSAATTTWSVGSLNPGDVVTITITPLGVPCAQPGTANCTATNCPSPVVNPVGSLSVCANENISSIVFSSPTPSVIFNWTNNNTAIGLAGSGTGDIPSFTTSVNASTQVATLSVVAYDGICFGPAMTFTITVNPIVNPSFTSVAGICSGDLLTPLPITSNNGISGTWNPALNNLTTTTYTFTPSVGQCASLSNLTINVSQPITPTFASIPVSCYGAALTALPTTSLNGISGTWNPALNNTTTTTYTFTPNAGQCANTQTMTITVAPLVDITTVSTTNPNCVPGNNGIITVTAVGGIGTLNYDLGSGTQTSNVFTNLGSGNYTVTVSDANGCSASSTTNLSAPNAPSITNAVSSDITCNGLNNGSITVGTVSGGTTPYSYSIDNCTTYQGGNSFTNLSAGTYTVCVKDANNCTVTSTLVINEPAAMSITNLNTTNPNCVPGNNGSITVTASGGLGTLNYDLGSGSQTINTFTNLGSGNYTVTVSDANGCSAISTTNLSAPNAPSITNAVSSDITCNGLNNGSITISTVSGGTTPYSFSIDNCTTYQVGNSFTNLSAGTYTVCVKDANNCTVTSTLLINEPTAVAISTLSNTNPNCVPGNNGSITVTASGGIGTLNYDLGSGSQTNNAFANLGSGNYTVTVSDANGCSASITTNLSAPNAPSITNAVSSDISCNGLNNGSITVSTVSGGTTPYSYSIDNCATYQVGNNFTNLSTGIYTVCVKDGNNCTVTSTIIISEPTPISITNLNTTNPNCVPGNNGSITVTASGGIGTLNYDLGSGSQTSNAFTNLGSGNYTVTVSDANGCSASSTTNLSAPNAPSIIAVSTTNITCNGLNNGNITMNTVSGGTTPYSYSIDNCTTYQGGNSFSNLSAGIYTICVKDGNNCTVTNIVVITEPTAVSISNLNTTNPNCVPGNNGSITVMANGGVGTLNYDLGSGSQTSNTFSNLGAGNYTVTVSDANGCSASSTANLLAPNAPSLLGVGVKDITCYGANDGTIVSSGVSGGTMPFTYTLLPLGISNASGAFTGLGPGIYQIAVSDGNGCTALSNNVAVNEPAEIKIVNSVIQPLTCNDDINGSVELTVTGGQGSLTYTITPNSGIQINPGHFIQLPKGNYGIVIQDSVGCSTQYNFSIDMPTPIAVSLDVKPITCKGVSFGQIIATASGGSGDYVYKIRPGLVINKTGEFKNLHTGVYTLTITDSSGCHIDTAITIVESGDYLRTSISKKDLSCFGTGFEGSATASVEGGEAPYTVLWSTDPPQATATIDQLTFGYYFLEVTDQIGCVVKDTVYIEPGICCEEVFIPNAFSPNSDGNNDFFKVVTSAGIEMIQLEIYNRWGNRLWSARTFRDEWNGRYHETDQDVDTYFYIFKYKCLTDGQIYVKKGDLLLMR